MNLDLNKKINNYVTRFLQDNLRVSKIIAQIHTDGGTTVLVGGAVRDLFLGQETKDFDIEVYGLEPQALEKILSSFGQVQQIGKSFGVYLLPGISVDWSLPRTDSSGRKPLVEINPNLDFKTAFRRRDLTMNALGINLKTGELLDYFNGLYDLQNKILRYVDRDLFSQDPLRFYRVMQFVGRLQMVPDQDLNDLCSRIDLFGVSQERIEQEFNKLFLKSTRPSLGLVWLQKIGRLKEILPELFDTIGVLQNPEWHPEGDVFEHTKQVLDCAARQEYLDDQEKLIIMWSGLCHDLGKSKTTKLVGGRLRSSGHAQVGVKLAQNLLRRVTGSQELIKAVCTLVRYHMDPLQVMRNQEINNLAVYKKLAFNLYPQTLNLLVKLALADRTGRKPVHDYLPDKLDLSEDDSLNNFANQAKLAGVWEQIEAPVLSGRDLLDVCSPGPKLGELLAQAYLIQLEEAILDKQILKNKVLKKL
jgi:tRNA nucleotidyltransferase (CCA-adding enzyme)